MSWTTPAGLRAQVQKLWDRGALLAALAGDDATFPLPLRLKGPTSAELSDRFAEVREWVAALEAGAGYYRVEWRQLNHRVLGRNRLPARIWLDSPADALALLAKKREARRFLELLSVTSEYRPELRPWLLKHPLRALELAAEWPRLLALVGWLRQNLRPGIYLRQVELAGVHSKFIENHRAVLAELFDLALPPTAIDPAGGGVGAFCRRYGFRDKPARIRFRILDPQLPLLPGGDDQDLTVTLESFADLGRALASIGKIFITENEINFLAFPPHPESLVIFGAGYGFEALAAAPWLGQRLIYYWGDIDTHGLAILDQLRAHLPQTRSLLMDRQTLLAHRELWGREPRPQSRELPRLTPAEQALYDDLRQNRWGEQLRLEQEKVGFAFLAESLRTINRRAGPAGPG